MHPDFVSLALFVRVCEARSITKAAAGANIALAAASRRISLLEDLYGVKLLLRTKHGTEPTLAGEAVLRSAQHVIACMEGLREQISDWASGTCGLVRVEVNTSAMAQCFAADLATFCEAFPEAKVELAENRSEDIVDTLHRGAADVGIVAEGVAIRGLAAFDYRFDRLVALVPREHRIIGDSVTYGTLLKHDFVGFDRSAALSRILIARAAEECLPYRLRAEVKSFDAIGRMVEAGFGLAILPRSAVERLIPGLAIRMIPLAEAWANRRMMLCVRDYAGLPFIARKLVEHLRHYASRAQASKNAPAPRRSSLVAPAQPAAIALVSSRKGSSNLSKRSFSKGEYPLASK